MLLDDLAGFHGALAPPSAIVYVRLEGLGDRQSEYQLRGRVRGPFCDAARMLPADLPLQDLGRGPTLLARAIVPDPCAWTPQLPAVYRAIVELVHGGQAIERAERLLGLRWLGRDGDDLRRLGNRWVWRAIQADRLAADEIEAFAAVAEAAVVEEPDDSLCEAASRRGVYLAAVLEGPLERLAARLRSLARWPAVAMAVLPGETPEDFPARAHAPNLIFVQRCDRPGHPPAGWADALLCQADGDYEFARIARRTGLPVIACTSLPQTCSLEEARCAVDGMQRNLASIGQFAGYVARIAG